MKKKFLRASVILGKKQIVLASLVLILGVAVYLNWQFSNVEDLSITKQLDETLQTSQKQADTKKGDTITNDKKKTDKTVETAQKPKGNEETKYLGEAQLVSAQTIVDDTYFAKAKLARTKTRDMSVETIGNILKDEKLTDVDKKEVATKAIEITDNIEAENRIENLVKAKGYAECMVYINQKNANIVVKTDGLKPVQATQIKNIVVTESAIKGENVSIIEVS